MDHNDRIKRTALILAVRLYGSDPASSVYAAEAVLQNADLFAKWLGNPVVSLAIVPDRVTYGQDTPHSLVSTLFVGGTVELKDNQQVALSLHATDAKGFVVNEPGDVTLAWSSSDDTVVSVQPAADGLSCEAVAGNPGSALVNVTDGTRTGSLAFDVTAGDVSAITVEAGTPEDQPPAA